MKYLEKTFTVPTRNGPITACEKCVFGTGEHSDHCVCQSLNAIDRLLAEAEFSNELDASARNRVADFMRSEATSFTIANLRRVASRADGRPSRNWSPDADGDEL